ncbi:DUF4129 domain-containing protein [Prauserella flavalba]|uniref:Protein-glutamine gamma-glutamyltransferase-like C-terminal domain-containing protein n=1 Tax=Prauserella flavalba TaxID=1477506 RepID=A0A318LRP4_9PSEU|nr:DUF4129 domain-containing protein [Prauserella flavalba]PXY37403.1 hypothetical protein BA062_06675 [Prauserella flavalba]
MIGLADVPVDVGRDEAQRAAREELADRVYQEAQPGLVERVVDWLADRLADFFGVIDGAPGGAAGLVLFLVLLVVLVVVVRLRTGKVVRRRRVRRAEVFTGPARKAAAHRLAAERARAGGEYAEAVREWFRAIARELEERGVLDERSGRTADELAAEAGALLPGSAAELRAAAVLFDDVHYGGRAATAEGVERLAALDAAVRESRAVAT